MEGKVCEKSHAGSASDEDHRSHRIRVQVIADEPRMRALLRDLMVEESPVEIILEWAGEKRLEKKPTPYIRRLPVSLSGGRIRFLNAEEIDWIEAASQYVRLYVGKKSHLIRESMARLESRLDPRSFQRIHRSTIVNLDRVRELHTDSPAHRWAILADGHRLQVSQVYWKRFRGALVGLP